MSSRGLILPRDSPACFTSMRFLFFLFFFGFFFFFVLVLSFFFFVFFFFVVVLLFFFCGLFFDVFLFSSQPSSISANLSVELPPDASGRTCMFPTKSRTHSCSSCFYYGRSFPLAGDLYGRRTLYPTLLPARPSTRTDSITPGFHFSSPSCNTRLEPSPGSSHLAVELSLENARPDARTASTYVVFN